MFVSAAVAKVGGRFTSIAFASVAERPELFVIFIAYGSLASAKSDLAAVTVNLLELFLVVLLGVMLEPDDASKITSPDVVSKFEPLTTTDTLPPALSSTASDVAGERPSTSIFVIVGGLSIDFQIVPS